MRAGLVTNYYQLSISVAQWFNTLIFRSFNSILGPSDLGIEVFYCFIAFIMVVDRLGVRFCYISCLSFFIFLGYICIAYGPCLCVKTVLAIQKVYKPCVRIIRHLSMRRTLIRNTGCLRYACLFCTSLTRKRKFAYLLI